MLQLSIIILIFERQSNQNDKFMNKKQTRIIFMGTPDISARVLNDLVTNGFNVVALIAQMDKPFGRKGEMKKVPTKEVAEKYHIPVYQPIKIRLDYEFVKTLNPDVIITFAYGQIIPQGMLDIPSHGCINLHASLLPKYRGAAPIQRVLINGETKTGVTLMEMVAAMDAGKMYAVEDVSIEPDDNFTSLKKKVSDAASKLILDKLPDYIDGKLPGIEQDSSLMTLANKILPEDEHLNLSLKADEIVNWIRALSKEPGAYLNYHEQKLKIFKAHIVSNKIEGLIGEIVSDKKQLVFQAVDGQIAIDELQLAGKAVMDAKSFINGHRNILHERLT